MGILIVEDEKKLGAFLKKGLKQEGLSCEHVTSAEAALDYAVDHDCDLIILDLNLPDKDGISLLKSLRQEGVTAPVLVLTARDSVDDKVRGLESGANDYLTKPFSFRELIARVRVLLRPSAGSADVLTLWDLTVNSRDRHVSRGGKELSLTTKEFLLLDLLIRNAGRPVSRSRLWEHAWEGSFDLNSNVLDVHMGRLRGKVDKGFKVALIHTLHGTGYTIRAPK